EAVAVGGAADERDLEIPDRLALGEVTGEDLRQCVELVGDDVQVPIVVQVKDRGRACAQVAEDGDLPCLPAAGEPAGRLLGAVEIEEGRLRASSSPRLDPQEELRVAELLAAVVQQERVDGIAEREAHARRDEDILPAIRV